jgi:hypothetical protein
MYTSIHLSSYCCCDQYTASLLVLAYVMTLVRAAMHIQVLIHLCYVLFFVLLFVCTVKHTVHHLRFAMALWTISRLTNIMMHTSLQRA